MPNLHVAASAFKSLSYTARTARYRMAAFLSAGLLLAAIACTGNGGAVDSGGDTYNVCGGGNSSNPGTTTSGGGSGSSTGSGGSSSSGGYTASDLFNFANSGDTDKIIQIVSQDSGTTEAPTQTVTMSAADLGLPAGGTVTLTVTGGGVSFSETRGAGADGFVSFEVPMVESNKPFSIELIVRDAGGTPIFIGNQNQGANGTGDLEVKLVRQFWTLPASLLVTASPSTIAYNDSAPHSTSVTFSIANLDDVPAGTVLAYSWKDADGNEVGTGSTLTRTAGQMLDPAGTGTFTITQASEERTYSVEVSYTEPSGEQVTRSGSATATIVTTAAISLSGSSLQTEGDRQILVLNKGSSAASLTASVVCYSGGVTYSWGSDNPAVASVTGSSLTAGSVTPSQGGMATVTVTADLDDSRQLTKEVDVYVLDILMTGSDIPAVAGDPIIITDNATDSTSLHAALTGLSVSGVSYEWNVVDSAVAAASPASGADTTVHPVAAGTTSVRVRATYKSVTTDWSSQPLNVAALKLFLTPGGAAAGEIVMKKDDSVGVTRYASVVNGTGLETFTWSTRPGDTAVSILGGTGSSCTMLPGTAGGKAVITVSTTVNGRPLSKTVDAYVLDLVVSGSSLSSDSTSPTLMTTDESASLTASLAGITDADFTWSVENTALADLTDSGTHRQNAAIAPLAAGATRITVSTTYKGVSVQANRYIAIIGLSITGDEVLEKGTTGTLTASVAGYGSGITYSWTGVPGKATVTDGSAATTVTALGTGEAEISVTATLTAAGKSLEKSFVVTVVELVVKQGASVVPSSGNIVADNASVTLTAELKGPPAGSTIDYEWTSSDGAKIPVTAAHTASKTLTPLAAGDADITVTATYKGVSFSTVMSWTVGSTSLSGSVADFLGATFAPNELSSAYTVSLTGAVTAAQLTSIAKAIGDSADSNFKGVYISLDLSGASIAENYIPNDTFNASSNADLATYLAGIVLPDTLATLGHRAFKGCTNLSGSVTIPSSCTLIGEDPFLDTGVTSLSDATPGRTWSRKWTGGGLVPTPNAWSGTLADADALSRIDADRPDIGDYNYSTP